MKTLLAFLQRQKVTAETKEVIIIEAARHIFKPNDFAEQKEADSVIEIPVPWEKG